MTRGSWRIGTSGWSYAHWGGGRFYPRGLKAQDRLAFLASQFDTVELNASFYRLPRAEVVAHWARAVGSTFRFAVKIWRRMTHERRLRNCAADLRTFFDVVGAFGAKRGPLRVQLPPGLHCDAPLLDEFLGQAREHMGRRPWSITVEFRSPDWLCDEVMAVLDRHGAALCLSDLARCPVTEPNQAAFVYVRRHGPTGPYRGCYSARHIAADARRVRRWLEAGRDVFLYYNNDVEGHAVENARALVALLERD